jgi:hypothetical protein
VIRTSDLRFIMRGLSRLNYLSGIGALILPLSHFPANFLVFFFFFFFLLSIRGGSSDTPNKPP